MNKLFSKLKFRSSDTVWYLTFSIFNALIALAINLNNIPSEILFWSLQSFIFAISALLGHFIFLFLLAGFPGWAISRIWLTARKLGLAILVLSSMLLLIVIYLNARIFELYKFHIDDMVLELITGGALQEILSFNFLMWSLIVGIATAFVIFEIVVAVLLFRFINSNRSLNPIAYSCLILFLVSALISQSIYMVSDAKGDRSITALGRFIPWAQTVTAKARLKKLGVEVVESNTISFNSVAETINYPKNTLTCTPEKKLNILFIIVDSLRADMLDSEVMPGTWKLAQQGHSFENYFSLSNSTRFGIFTLMYGINGNFWHNMLANQIPSAFIDELVKQEYELYIHAAATLSSPEFDRTVFASVKEKLNTASAQGASHKKDKHITDSFLEILDQHDEQKPFFGFLFYDSPHSYSYPKNFKEKFTPSLETVNYLELNNDFDPEPFFNRYKNSVRYTDGLIQEVIEKLKSKGLDKNTVIMITGDHGQEFNETRQNFWGHNGNFSKYQMQVPLVLYWPVESQLHGRQKHQEQIASIDIVPTLMSEVLNCSNPVSDYSSGLNIYYPQNNYSRPLLMESWSKSAIMGENYIFVSHDFGGGEVFDREYQPKPELTPPSKDMSAVFKQMTQFNK